jgi:lysophospholipase L1-like esterase
MRLARRAVSRRAQSLKERSTASAAAVAQAAPQSSETAAPAKAAPVLDWPNLSRYRAEDAVLPPPAPGVKRVVFIGDSITDGWGRWKGTGEFFPGKPYLNRGISGQTTPQILVRFEQDVVHLKPAAVVILAGTNDIAGNTGPSTPKMIEDNLASMADIAKADGIAVVMASITPAIRYPWNPSRPFARSTDGSASSASGPVVPTWTTTRRWPMPRAGCCPAFRPTACIRWPRVTPSWRRWRRRRSRVP